MKKILIVDDDNELRANLSEVIQGAGYSTIEAANGNEAVENIMARNFDVILLDLMMPGISGTDLLNEIRKLSPRAKVIMITAFATIDNAVQAIRKGASDYISKPFRINDLLMTIRRVLEEASFEREATNLDIDYILSSLANPIRRNIVRLLHERVSMRLMEITRELDIGDHTKVLFHLKSLKESHIIEQNRAKAYVLTKEGNETVECLNIIKNYLA